MSAGPFGWPQGPPPSRTGARLKFWGAAAVAVLLLGSAGVGIRYLRSRPHRGPVSGYEERVEVLQREYRDFYGRLMSDAGAERLFELLLGDRPVASHVDLREKVLKRLRGVSGRSATRARLALCRD